METSELIEIIYRGDDSRHQFKSNFSNSRQLAEEFIAFTNSNGGMIIIGVGDDGNVSGLTEADIRRLNQLIPNTAADHVRPPINVEVENKVLSDKLVMIVTVREGISKPYMNNDGIIIVKNGADKRRVTSREEIQRMFQSAGLIHGDEIPANGLSIADIDFDYFAVFLNKEFNESVDMKDDNLSRILVNMNLADKGVFNIAGALLFSKNPQFRLPAFIVKAVSYPGNIIDEEKYIDSRDITGKLADVFQGAYSFILGNLSRRQGEKGINSTGDPEVPRIVFEELLVNALIHRDYFITAPVRIFIFSDRIEIISPGHLPNNLTIENIKSGNSNMRNPVLASFATRLLPYMGLGSGIRRALNAYPYIEFVDDRDGNLFKVIIKRL